MREIPEESRQKMIEGGRRGGIRTMRERGKRQRKALASRAASALNDAMTPEQRTESARRAALARWARNGKTE